MSFFSLFSERSPSLSSVWGPSHGRVVHALLQCESIPWAAVLCKLLQSGSLFHCMQAFKDMLLHHGSFTGLRVLPGNLLQCGLFSPWVCRSLPGGCSSMGLLWGPSLLSGIHIFQCGSLPWAAGETLHPHGPLWVAGEHPASP